jgi:hypothetical protein
MSKRSHKTAEIKVFLLFLPNDRRIEKHVDPVDPDPGPQHCEKHEWIFN